MAKVSRTTSPIHIAATNGATSDQPRAMTRDTSATIEGPGVPAFRMSTTAKIARAKGSKMVSIATTYVQFRPPRRSSEASIRWASPRSSVREWRARLGGNQSRNRCCHGDGTRQYSALCGRTSGQSVITLSVGDPEAGRLSFSVSVRTFAKQPKVARHYLS
jgi:hypothetical protein